jgi:hypothetical protein
VNISAVLTAPLFDLIDKLFTSDDERSAAKLKLLELEKSGELAQIGVNMKEAQSSNVFVAGWRPFIGWVCGAAFAWHFILLPVVTVILLGLGVPFIPPAFEMQALMTVLMGMLGLGGLRTFEKVSGVADSNITTVTKNILDRSAKR